MQQESVLQTLRQKLEDTYNSQMRQTVVDILALIHALLEALAAMMKLSEPHILIDQPDEVRGFWN